MICDQIILEGISNSNEKDLLLEEQSVDSKITKMIQNLGKL